MFLRIASSMQAVRQALCAPRLSAALNLVALSPALTTSLSTLAISLGDLERDEEHDKRYVDRLKITARGGKGGNGCVSFYQGASRGNFVRNETCAAAGGGGMCAHAANRTQLLPHLQFYPGCSRAACHGRWGQRRRRRQRGGARSGQVSVACGCSRMRRLRRAPRAGAAL